jgi:hypothetical protein
MVYACRYMGSVFRALRAWFFVTFYFSSLLVTRDSFCCVTDHMPLYACRSIYICLSIPVSGLSVLTRRVAAIVVVRWWRRGGQSGNCI